MLRVSVVIPTHNRLAMLQQAMESVQAQTIAEWELIVVDDGSDDGTWQWLQSQPGIRSIRHPRRLGPSAARNRGVAQAGADLIAFLDSDDLFLPDKLRLQLSLLAADRSAALCHSNEIWIRDGRPVRQQAKHEKRGGWIFEHCLPMCRISPSAAVVRRELLLEEGGFDEELEVAEDYELWLRLTCRHAVAFVEEPLVVKRGGHPDQLSMRDGRIEMFRVEALRRMMQRASLTDAQHEAALDVLRHKCELVARGCEKRGDLAQAADYRRLPLTLRFGA